MGKTVFLDRDGVINVDRKDFVKSVEELSILPNVIDGLRLLTENGFRLIIITNQSCIARRIVNADTVNEINRYLCEQLGKSGVKINGVYICPHADLDNCACRKPKTGLFLQAAKEFGINLSDSYAIGDSKRDIVAAKTAGCRTIHVRGGKEEFVPEADYKCENLVEAANLIMR